ncbi:hypothetical protein ACE1SV_08010 [Streptomyces sennicomposti]
MCVELRSAASCFSRSHSSHAMRGLLPVARVLPEVPSSFLVSVEVTAADVTGRVRRAASARSLNRTLSIRTWNGEAEPGRRTCASGEKNRPSDICRVSRQTDWPRPE